MPVPPLERERTIHGIGVEFSQHFFNMIRGVADRFPGFPEIEPEDIHMVKVEFPGGSLSREPAKAIVIGKKNYLIDSPDARIIIKKGDWDDDLIVDLSRVVKDWNIPFGFEMTRQPYDAATSAYDYHLEAGDGTTVLLSDVDRRNGGTNRLCVLVDTSSAGQPPPFARRVKWYPWAVNIVCVRTNPGDIEPVTTAKRESPGKPKLASSAVIFSDLQSSTAEGDTQNPVLELARGVRHDLDKTYSQIKDTVGKFIPVQQDFSPVPSVERMAFLKGTGTPVGIKVEKKGEVDTSIRFEFMNFDVLKFLYSHDQSLGSFLGSFNPQLNNWLTLTLARNGIVTARINGTSHKDLHSLEIALSSPRIFAALFLELQAYGTMPAREQAHLPLRRKTYQREPPVPPGTQKNQGKNTTEIMEIWHRNKKGRKKDPRWSTVGRRHR